MKRVLLVEDEKLLAEIMSETLESRGFEVHRALDGQKGLDKYRKVEPDICILDVMMPEMDGYALAKKIRQENAAVPIIFVTAKSQMDDLKKGFEVGANDYLKKPFSIEELIVRMNALLSRSSDQIPAITEDLSDCTIGHFDIDFTRQRLTCHEGEVRLTGRESEMLKLLYLNRNEITDKSDALKKLWGDDSFFNSRSMDVFITKLRKHLKSDPNVEIINIRGKGYKLVC